MSSAARPQQDFAGKIAFITGGASGIGKATCEILASRGAKVAVVDLRDEQAKAVADEITKKHNTTCIGIGCDVSQWPEVDLAVKTAVSDLGGLHCALNAAGLPAWVGNGIKMHEYPVESWQKQMNVNANGVFYCVKAQITEFMKKQTKGAIVNISSCAGQRAIWLGSAYVASKHACHGITQSASLEYSRYGIRTNSIAPGYVETPMLGLAAKEDDDKWKKATPMGRIGKPEEIAELIAFLLSDKAAYITGGYYTIDGGWMNCGPGEIPS